MSDYAAIDAMSGPFLAVHSTRHPEIPGTSAPYFLVISSYTIIEPDADGAQATTGSYADTNVGDTIYYVGSSDSPDNNSVVYAWRVFP